MIYTSNDYNRLPTLTELLDNLKTVLTHQAVRHLSPIEPVISDSEKFIVTRLMSGRYSLKPNISMQSALFRGESYWDEENYSCRPFLLRDKPRYVIQNLKYEELMIAMESHPLYKLLAEGIELSNKMFLQICNPYGIAMCYNLKTSLLSFTSDLEVAAFYACCEKNENGEYQPILNKEGNKKGILYIFNMLAPFCMIPGLSTVGLQPFPRCGVQKAFALNLPPGQDLRNHKFIVGFVFRHDENVSQRIYNQFNHGRILEPNADILANKAIDINSSLEISSIAFRRNLQKNPSNKPTENEKEINDKGYSLSQKRNTAFTQDELESYYSNSIVIWEEFCKDIVFPGRNSDSLLDALKSVPKMDRYKKYFTR